MEEAEGKAMVAAVEVEDRDLLKMLGMADIHRGMSLLLIMPDRNMGPG